MRAATTPDCGVTRCERAAYKYGVCRRHHALLPFSFRQDAMSEVFAAHRRNAKRAARVAAKIERATS